MTGRGDIGFNDLCGNYVVTADASSAYFEHSAAFRTLLFKQKLKSYAQLYENLGIIVIDS